MTSLSELVRLVEHGWRGHKVSRFVAPLALCISVGAAGASVRAEDTHDRGRIHVDIPAQPLATALDAYCAAAGLQMFVDTEAVAGRRSAAIQGEFTREDALQGLLSGTALAARFVGDRGFTLVAPPAAGADAGATTSRRYDGYSALLQTGLRKALCRSEDTRPGTYRLLSRFWIDAHGTISHAELITSTGNRGRDAALLSTLQDVAVGEAPPPDLPQPVTLLLTANTMIAAEYCAGGAPGLPPVKPAAEARH